jgi:hypothetical protein
MLPLPRRPGGRAGEGAPRLHRARREGLTAAASQRRSRSVAATAGPIAESQDRLVETELKVCDEVTILVAHCLLARCPIEQVETVYAQPQAADQCSRWIVRNLPGRHVVHVVHVASNGLAAERATQERGVAAIAPRVASGVFGLASWPPVSRTFRTTTPASGSSASGRASGRAAHRLPQGARRVAGRAARDEP